MKILITNDDGITTEGISSLAKLAKKYGEVTVVAPDSQRSATSHSITLHSHIDIIPYDLGIEGVSAYSCSGTPADCVRVGSLSILKEIPDVVISGINFGYNLATDIQYSGTVGAALEGAYQGSLAIALSEGTNGCHDVRDGYLEEILDEIIYSEKDNGRIINVNFPDCKLDECKGILRDRFVSNAMPFIDRYKKKKKLIDGGMRVMIDGIRKEEAEEGSDFKAVIDKYSAIGTVNNYGFDR